MSRADKTGRVWVLFYGVPGICCKGRNKGGLSLRINMFVNFVGCNEKTMQQTELILTRHGETLENRQDMMQGHLPGTLSPLGIQQAENLADLLAPEKIEAIVCSDLARSYDTAKIIGKRRGMLPRQTSLLREIDWGRYTGGRLSSIDWRHLPEGCETLESLMQRADLFIRWFRREYRGRCVLVVGHGAIDRAILAFLEGKSVEEMAVMPIMKNTSFVKKEIR